MKARRLTLLIMLYVMADFSNPLMPGAVNFDESVEATTVHRESVERPTSIWPRIRSDADAMPPSSELSRPEGRPVAVPPKREAWLRPRVHGKAHELRSPSEDH